MDEHQMRQILDWFHTRVGRITCSVCSHSDFRIDSELTLMPVWRVGPPPRVDFSDGVVAVMVTCTHCASVRLFSTAKMGLTPASSRPTRTPTHPGSGSADDS